MPCDTFVAVKSGSDDNTTIFGKNSDRPEDEVQNVRWYPPGDNGTSGQRLKCTYIEIPPAEETFEVMLCQPFWMWGAESGANDQGVAIGNEAVWTKVPHEPNDALLGMDLVRLGLERGATARTSMDVITGLLQTHGQGGSCSYNGPKWEYHNSFLIADPTEAWILETAGRHWAAERIVDGVRNISNNLSIHRHDQCSDGLEDYAREQGFWGDDDGDFSFARCFSSFGCTPDGRECQGKTLLEEQPVTIPRMMEILRDHDGGICMHGGFTSTASQVSYLSEDPNKRVHFFTGTPNPCQSVFKPAFFNSTFTSTVPARICTADLSKDRDTLWWRHSLLAESKRSGFTVQLRQMEQDHLMAVETLQARNAEQEQNSSIDTKTIFEKSVFDEMELISSNESS